MVKNLPEMQETWVRYLGREVLQEKGMATHSSILAWRIPWTEEFGRLQSMGLRVRHDWATNTHTHTHIFLMWGSWDTKLNELPSSQNQFVKECKLVCIHTVHLYTAKNKLMTLCHHSSGGLVAKLCWLSCHPMDCSLPVSSVCGLSQARILEWIAISFSRRSSQTRDRTCISCIAARFFYWLSHQGSPGHHRCRLLYRVRPSDYIAFAHMSICKLNGISLQKRRRNRMVKG